MNKKCRMLFKKINLHIKKYIINYFKINKNKKINHLILLLLICKVLISLLESLVPSVLEQLYQNFT